MTTISINSNRLDITIESGSFVIVTGLSGSGKSTLLRNIENHQPNISFDPPDPTIETVYYDVPTTGTTVYRKHDRAFTNIINNDPDIVLIDEIDSGPQEQRPEIQRAMRDFRNNFSGTAVCVTMDRAMKEFGDRLIELERIK